MHVHRRVVTGTTYNITIQTIQIKTLGPRNPVYYYLNSLSSAVNCIISRDWRRAGTKAQVSTLRLPSLPCSISVLSHIFRVQMTLGDPGQGRRRSRTHMHPLPASQPCTVPTHVVVIVYVRWCKCTACLYTGFWCNKIDNNLISQFCKTANKYFSSLNDLL